MEDINLKITADTSEAIESLEGISACLGEINTAPRPLELKADPSAILVICTDSRLSDQYLSSMFSDHFKQIIRLPGDVTFAILRPAPSTES